MAKSNSGNSNLTKLVVRRNLLLTSIVIVLFCACGGSSSPEGRMSMKIEDLQREMIDSLKIQNRAILEQPRKDQGRSEKNSGVKEIGKLSSRISSAPFFGVLFSCRRSTIVII